MLSFKSARLRAGKELGRLPVQEKICLWDKQQGREQVRRIHPGHVYLGWGALHVQHAEWRAEREAMAGVIEEWRVEVGVDCACPSSSGGREEDDEEDEEGEGEGEEEPPSNTRAFLVSPPFLSCAATPWCFPSSSLEEL